ncbi:hypothetical protein GGS21DRAFT_494085 [Xylaria nigripes]|nr:hypothetical protein GGS21DRAFT_494085 [Xylaria nigripes]
MDFSPIPNLRYGLDTMLQSEPVVSSKLHMHKYVQLAQSRLKPSSVSSVRPSPSVLLQPSRTEVMAQIPYIHLLTHYLDLLVRFYSLVVVGLLVKLRTKTPVKPTDSGETFYLTEPVAMAEETDKRPHVSPFTSKTVRVILGDGQALNVPKFLLNTCPKLQEISKTAGPPHMVDVKLAVGHAIFYYLLTDQYQCLRPGGKTDHDRLVAELKTGIQVYIAARKYQLPGLQSLARKEIQVLADKLPFLLVLNLFQDLDLEPNADETWVDEFVQSGLLNIFQKPTACLEDSSLRVEKGALSFTNIVLKNLAEVLSKDLAPARKDIVPPTEPTPEPAPAVEPEPAPTTEPEPAPATEPEPAPTTEPEPAPATEPEPDLTTEAEPARATEPEPDLTTEAEPAPATEAEPASIVSETAPADETITSDFERVPEELCPRNIENAPEEVVSADLNQVREVMPESEFGHVSIPEAVESKEVPSQTPSGSPETSIKTPSNSNPDHPDLVPVDDPIGPKEEYAVDTSPRYMLEPALEPVTKVSSEYVPPSENSDSRHSPWIRWGRTKMEEPLTYVVEGEPCSRREIRSDMAAQVPPRVSRRMKKRSLRLLDGSSPSPLPALESESQASAWRS